MILNFQKFALYLILLFVAFSCESNNKTEVVQKEKEVFAKYLSCDVETLVKEGGNKFLLASDSSLLSGGWLQSDEEAHSGNYSVKVGGKSKYALQVTFPEIKRDMFIRATVWKKGSGGLLAFTSLETLKFDVYSKQVLETDSNAWEKIILEAFVPANFSGEEIKLFVMNQKEEIVYFDDLELKVFNTKPYPDYSEMENIDLIIDKEYLNEIDQNRIISFQEGVITENTQQSYPAVFKYGKKEFPAEVRIKGDWLDHIQGNKWSFRIKLLEGNFKGMKEFSIQEPGTRGFINEYVLHQLFIKEDVLTTRYGFVPVNVNGERRGIYAYEEHFAKHLIESRRRREGPIIKFDETGIWEVNQKNLVRKEKFLSGPTVESAVIIPFKTKKTLKNPSLKGNFLIAQNLLRQFQYDASPVSELFKIDQLARFYALVNLGRSWHPLRWHNERFYYDPVSSMLEIIAFDCYTTADLEKTKAYFSPELIILSNKFSYDRYLGYSPFNDQKFVNAYVKAVDEYLYKDFIATYLETNASELDSLNQLIKKEYLGYNYNPAPLINDKEEVVKRWEALKPKLEKGSVKAKLKISAYNYKQTNPLDGLNLTAYLQSSYEIKVMNFHSSPLYLYAYSSKKFPEQGIVKFDKMIEFKAYKSLSNIDKKQIACNFTPGKLYYKTSVNDTIIYDCNVNDWPEPELTSPRQTLQKKNVLRSGNVYTLKDSIVYFNKGKHTISSPIIIPEGKKVVMEEGVQLDFINKAFFMSFSPVQLKGTKNNEVLITSSDSSAMGFTIIDAKTPSSLDWVIFEDFNTLSYEGWNLTGAVTFYESNVAISNTQFNENHCEDALNIIRSEFTMIGSSISDAFADGFDTDFATGMIESCQFIRIGNDGVDFSGSTIELKNVSIDHAGDKGISGGEGSTLFLENISVENSNIGLASKDRSVVNGKGISIKNTYCAFAVYQKKTEYDPARLYVENVELENITRKNLLGEGSILVIDEIKNIGIEKINIDSLYGW